MANKFKYSHPANEVVQVATMEEPDQHIWNRFSQSTRTEDPQAFEICTAYQQHLSALARYPCQGFGKEDDAKEFEKGVHFIVREHRRGHGDGILYNCAVRIPDKGEVVAGTKMRDQLHNILMSGDNLLEKVEALLTFAVQSAPAYPAEFVEWVVAYSIVKTVGEMPDESFVKDTTAELYQEYLQSKK